jgi:GPH family glycoside/pentoside/hexuronide:cation symporter
VGLGGYALLWVVADKGTMIFMPLCLIGFGAGASYLGFWAMMPDTVEYGQVKTRIRSEGGVFGVVSLIQKGALGLAAGALGEMLSLIGYRANALQSQETLEAMRVIMIPGAAGMAALAAMIIAFYPIDQRTHDRLRRIIAGRARVAAELRT